MSDAHPDVARPAYPPDWPSAAPWWMSKPGGAIYLPEERGIEGDVAWDAGPRVVQPDDEGWSDLVTWIGRIAGTEPPEPDEPEDAEP